MYQNQLKRIIIFHPKQTNKQIIAIFGLKENVDYLQDQYNICCDNLAHFTQYYRNRYMDIWNLFVIN